jgi:Uncharacterized protein related to glutamine synthetase
MPKISLKAQSIPSSPIRKLVPLADAAAERGLTVYHLNIGQPDVPSPSIVFDALHDCDMLKTRHNEVAPNQFECAPEFCEANLAVDQNNLLMILMRKIASRHHLRVIFHEKPFAGVNGSGKHCNWSMCTDKGTNLLSPSATPGRNLQFLSVLVSVLRGVYKHHYLMLSAAGCDIRMIGVIDAGVAAALQDIPDKGHFAVGVMSNSVTLESRIYSREIADSAAARKVRIDLVEQDCGSLDAAINVGSDSASAKAKSAFKELVDKYLATGPSVPMKCVILGSTHLPFVMDALNEELDELRNFRDKDDRAVYREIIADDFVFIDPSEYTAMACYNYLRSHKLLSLSSKKQTLCTYLSVPSYKLPEGCVDTFGNLTYNFKYGRQVGTEEVTTKQVPLSATRMDIESFSAIHGRLPHAYSMILKNIQH